ncbi:MAG: Rieske 2Fe-2S domain-containing protein [Acidimicrobiales bacterium]
MAAERARIGTVEELQKRGCLPGKVGSQPVCVFYSDGQAYAVDDRCPHMGFPLHRGTVENGLLTCHWHHARFDLASGGTLDPFADDVRAHDVEIDGDDVIVVLRPVTDAAAHHLRRLEEGLEQGLTLVTAKAVLGLIEVLGPGEGATAALRAGVAFGIANRAAGWGAGLTVLTAMANVLPSLDPDDLGLALVHGLAFVSGDTRGRPPRFPLTPLDRPMPAERVATWYRRFVDTRNGDAAERVLATAVASGMDRSDVADLMAAAVTDHLFVDGGHTIDFTNKAFEALDHLGWDQAESVLTSLAHQTAGASRSEESGEWRHPFDLPRLLAKVQAQPSGPEGATERSFDGDEDVAALAWSMLGEEPADVLSALDEAAGRGASTEEMARAVAYAAALRLVRFHTQNDHGDWDVVHHGFTSANAVHQMALRAPTPELRRGVYQGAMRVYLDRFLNVPAARLPSQRSPSAGPPDLADLQVCWDQEGLVDDAGSIVFEWLRAGGERAGVWAALGSALLTEDAEFHWFQTYEAAVRQSAAWPEGSEESALILVGAARFLAAHTPTRRELSQVVRIARRLRRGEALYEEV